MELKKFRVQLASNFQVVELEVEVTNLEDISLNNDIISKAVELVNDLGKSVGNDIKPSKRSSKAPASVPARKSTANTSMKVDKLPSDRQIGYAERLGLAPEEARSMSAEELWSWINANKD